MLQRLNRTKWLWCFLVATTGPIWTPARAIRIPPKVPANIETHAKFFQYRNNPSHEDFDQGHRLGSERHFTERHEKARPSEGLFSAKVRWGDKQGGYGEHYWDLNHAGHGKNHDNDDDDGSYRPDDSPFSPYRSDDSSYRVHDNDSNEDAYDEPSEEAPKYTEYNPEVQSDVNKEEANRAKRAHPKLRPEKDPAARPRRLRKTKEQTEAASKVETVETTESPKTLKPKPEKDEQEETSKDETDINSRDSNAQDQSENSSHEVRKPQQPTYYVPYERGAGVRQYQSPELVAAASVPRLFLEPSTGHVVDRATGQAYVLQPVVVNNYNY